MIELSALPWKDFITVGAAVLGAGLGIMNTWHSLNARRVRLRVRPAHAIMVPGGQRMFSIEVINLSMFAVTVAEVGFTLDGRRIGRGKRAAVSMPIVLDGKEWPRRLEARQSVSLYFELPDEPQRISKAYARTSCGEVRYGDSPALRQIRTGR